MLLPDRRPGYPVLHVRPDAGWINDPNGPFWWKGRYHLFFQYNPQAPVHDRIAWGHVSSDDLLHWRPEPVALAPEPGGPDAGGCWSGCVVDDDGTPTAVYTGIDADGRPSALLARALDDDLRAWAKHPSPVALPPEGPDGTPLTHWRDPFVLTVDGRRYAVIGAGGVAPGAASVLAYRCDDLERWLPAGTLLGAADAVAAASAPADVWECPQLLRFDDRWVLVVSLWTGSFPGTVAYLVGGLEAGDDSLAFTPTHGGAVDAGRDFYAPAALVGPDRTLLWGWTWEDRSETDVLAGGWAGALTLPRVLALDAQQRLVSSPAPELAALRGIPRHATLAAGGEPAVLPLPAGPLETEITVAGEGTVRLTLAQGGSPLALILDTVRGRADVERQVFSPDRAARPASAVLPSTTAPLGVRLLLDGSVVEIFVRDGPVFTERLHPGATGGGTTLTLAGTGSVHVRATTWPLHMPPAATADAP